MRIVLLVLVTLGAFVACSKKQNDEEAQAQAVATEYVAESVTKDLVELKQAIASDKPSDGTYKCAHMANIGDLKASDKHKALAAELETLCTKDLHLAIMKVEVEKAEAARKATPDDKVLSECYSAYFDVSRKEMETAKTIDHAKDLIARFETACPKE